MHSPSVSIVLNVLNGEPYIRETLQSVLAQTYRDWELVVWDDRSTDNTATTVAEFTDERIRYFLAPEKTPLGQARGLALQRTRGEWIAFIDHDDLWPPEKLALQMELANADTCGRVGLIYGRTVAFYSDGRQQDFNTQHEFRDLPEGNLFEELWRKSCFIGMSSAMFRRTALDAALPIPQYIELISDFYLFVKVAQHFEVRAVQHTLCRYRRHEGSLSDNQRRAMHEEALLLLRDMGTNVPPPLAACARRWCHTAIAVAEMSQPESFRAGAWRLLRRGSPAYVLSRPLARAYRTIRRRFGMPCWQTDDQVRPDRTSALASQAEYPLTLSIIVVNWRVRDLLRTCLESIYEHIGLPADQWELLVVDNDSRDGSAEMVRREFPEARLFANDENLGFGRANNQALPHCRGRYVLLVNPDVEFQDSAIQRMIEMADQHLEIGALGCRLMNPDRSLQQWTAGEPPTVLNIACHFLFIYRLLPARLLPKPLFFEMEPKSDAEVGWVSGACMLLRRAALGASIFDERYFMYCEDIHLCQSLWRAGWKVIYTPHAAVIHYGGQSINLQTPEVQLNKMTNLRRVFATRNGRAALVCFDASVAAGFFLRYVAFGLASALQPKGGYDSRALKSKQFLLEAVRSFGSR